MSQEVFVTNKNPKTHVDRYDGEEFVFPPGKPVVITKAAAQHFFAYGLPDKTEALHRLGRAFWLNRDAGQFEEDPNGASFLAKFEFEEAVLQPASALKTALEERTKPSVESLLG